MPCEPVPEKAGKEGVDKVEREEATSSQAELISTSPASSNVWIGSDQDMLHSVALMPPTSHLHHQQQQRNCDHLVTGQNGPFALISGVEITPTNSTFNF